MFTFPCPTHNGQNSWHRYKKTYDS